MYHAHPVLGYTNLPGRFKIVLSTGYTFQVTNQANALRVTHPPDTLDDSVGKKEMWVFGGSFTYGWALNDEESYPWLLQEAFPSYEVVNFGVSGYGTIHSLLQFREAVLEKSPDVVVLAYAGFHDERNTFVRKRGKQIAPWLALGSRHHPFVELNENGILQHQMKEVTYEPFPLMTKLPLAHFLEQQYNEVEIRQKRSHLVTQELIKEMAQLAARQQARFVFVNIQAGERMLDFTHEQGIPSVDISVNLRQPEYSNRPHDSHPSALANRLYAERLAHYLQTEVLN